MVVIRVATSASTNPTNMATTYCTEPPYLHAGPSPRIPTTAAKKNRHPVLGFLPRSPATMWVAAVSNNRPLIEDVPPRSEGMLIPRPRRYTHRLTALLRRGTLRHPRP